MSVAMKRVGSRVSGARARVSVNGVGASTSVPPIPDTTPAAMPSRVAHPMRSCTWGGGGGIETRCPQKKERQGKAQQCQAMTPESAPMSVQQAQGCQQYNLQVAREKETHTHTHARTCTAKSQRYSAFFPALPVSSPSAWASTCANSSFDTAVLFRVRSPCLQYDGRACFVASSRRLRVMVRGGKGFPRTSSVSRTLLCARANGQGDGGGCCCLFATEGAFETRVRTDGGQSGQTITGDKTTGYKQVRQVKRKRSSKCTALVTRH